MGMRAYEERRAKIHDAAQKARESEENFKSVADFARAVGINRNELGAFLKNKHLSDTKLHILERWLIDSGHLAPTPRAQELPEPYGQKLDISWIVGQEMITMGLWLQSPELSTKEKIARYKVWLDQASENLKKIVAVQEKRSE